MTPSCHIPWTWLEIDMTTQQVRSCCKTNWISDKNLDLFEHADFLQRRKDFLSNKKPIECNHCWNLENNNQISYRQYTKIYHTLQTNNYNISQQIPKRLSINFGNICNLSCSYCNEEYSSVWAAEKNISIKKEKDLDYELKIYSWLEKILVDNTLKEIILIGGEPSINPLFYNFLNLLEMCSKFRTQPVKITVQTNGMFDHRQLEKIISNSKIKNCNITYRFSIDAIEERLEFIRTGLKWSTFKFNFENLIFNSVKVAIHPTLSIYSLGGLSDFLDWVSSYNYEWEDLGKNHIEHPFELSLTALGKNCKDILPSFKNYNDNSLRRYITQVLLFVNSFKENPNINSIKKGLEYHSSRTTVSKEIAVPELINFLNKYDELNTP